MAERTVNTGPPDFIGVGAQRAGTTWWFRTLVAHPELRGARRGTKELHFFAPFQTREMSAEDVARYHALFPRTPGQLAGEWTPRYMRDVWVPPLLRRAAPDAKLLVLVRDPIERYRSGMQHQLTRTPDRRWIRLADDAVDRGRYALQVERLRAFFPEDRVLVQQYEKCRADPAGEYRRALRFLGVDSDHEPQTFDELRGTTAEPMKRVLWTDLYQSLRVTLEPEVDRLAALVPEIDLTLWPNFAYLATGTPPPEEDPRAQPSEAATARDA